MNDLKQSEQQQQKGSVLSQTGVLNMLCFFFMTTAACFKPFLRSRQGCKSFGSENVMAIFAMLCYTAFAPCPELFIYFPVWFIMVIYRRLTADKHQYVWYDGYPWLTGLLFRNALLAQMMECILLVAIGSYVYQEISITFGTFFLVGAVGTLGVFLFIEFARFLRKERIQQAVRENELLAEEFEQFM